MRWWSYARHRGYHSTSSHIPRSRSGLNVYVALCFFFLSPCVRVLNQGKACPRRACILSTIPFSKVCHGTTLSERISLGDAYCVPTLAVNTRAFPTIQNHAFSHMRGLSDSAMANGYVPQGVRKQVCLKMDAIHVSQYDEGRRSSSLFGNATNFCDTTSSCSRMRSGNFRKMAFNESLQGKNEKFTENVLSAARLEISCR